MESANGKKVRIVFKKPLGADTMDRATMQELILHAPLEELFDFKEPSYALPLKATIFQRITCEQCGEAMAENMARLQEGKKVCLDCFSGYSRGWYNRPMAEDPYIS